MKTAGLIEERAEAQAGNAPSGGGTLLLLRPRGFCAGVVRAVDIVRLALEKLGRPVYVRREIVHNRYVVDELAEQGAVFIEELDEAPEGAVVIFSAHGVSPAVRQRARERGLRVIDATCPLVTKVHVELIRYVRENYSVVLIGHRDHDEVIGTLGEAPGRVQLITSVEDVGALQVPDPQRIAYLTQTTLSVDDTAEILARLKQRFPAIVSPPGEDICYATQNRQSAVKAVAPRIDLLLVVGARNSSNSNRLVEVAERAGSKAYLVNSANQIHPAWLEGQRRIGITAGASTPEVLVQEVVLHLQQKGYTNIQDVNLIEEDVRFALPVELRA
ncbi:MAG TPA: 4-hydroxy-3-methylbut-2-enyl diphosphate reductase [Terriglobia bacterium]|nr:4-hydroxy-3-methylbut-2-enyl diphosphate reductase [Terriglobia bacterium]